MLMNDFERGIERLIGNWGEKAISPGLIRELKNRYFIRDAKIWDQMITLVLDRCKYSPKMVNFREAMESLKNEVSSSAQNAHGKWCGKCIRGFLEKYLLYHGRPYTTMVPCSCHPAPPEYDNQNIREKIWITKKQYQDAWVDFRLKIKEDEEREKNGQQKPDRTGGVWSANIPPSPKPTTPEPDCTDDDERKAIQAIEKEEETTPPASW